MSPLHGNHRCTFVATVILLLSVMCRRTNMCKNDIKELCDTLFVSGRGTGSDGCFTSNAENKTQVTLRLCFNMEVITTDAGCCCSPHFNCSVLTDQDDNFTVLFTDRDTLSRQDIVVMTEGPANFSCLPTSYNETGFLLEIHDCLKMENVMLTEQDLDNICGDGLRDNNGSSFVHLWVSMGGNSSYCELDKGHTGGEVGTSTTVPVQNTEVTTPFSDHTDGEVSTSITVPVRDSDEVTSPEKAANLMKNLSFLLEQMGNASSAAVTIGKVRGVITRVSPQKQPGLYFHRVESGDVLKWEENGPLEPADTHSVSIPSEAIALAVEQNGSFAAVMFFQEMYQDDPTSSFLYNQVVGIEMGVQIQNVSESIDVEFNGVTENGSIFSCRAWDGEGDAPVWTTDGCRTRQNNGSITCMCSHLTFFAILMSPPPVNGSASDLRTLTQITSAGCGLSLFFLLLALAMHCLIRRGKSNLSTQILMQLLVATSTLNLSFLVNESIAGLGHFSACVAIAAILHYSLLATFTWFLMQALHLFLSFHNVPPRVALYFERICVAGWVTPAAVVITLLGLRKYDLLTIHTSDGGQMNMCWIPDGAIHQWVNSGYYAVVFLFTFSVFIATTHQITLSRLAKTSEGHSSGTRRKAFSILGLLVHLGLTWAFALFINGPQRLIFAYIFTVLNSFQGFFLFIYYYKSSKTSTEEQKSQTSSNGSSTASSLTVVTSPYT